MKPNRHNVSLTAALLLGTLLTSAGAGQIRDRSPSQLIAFLTYQSDDRRGKPNTFSCGVFKLDREAARSLALIGEAAIPSIVEALDSIEKHGEESKYSVASGWLLSAFAKIQGAAAYPRLRQMMGRIKPSFSSLGLDTAIALSLGITSYVSASGESIPIIHCGRRGEPREALDQLILGWEKNDRRWLEGSLGPSARNSLRSLLKARTWKGIRRQFWTGRLSGPVAVGYRLETPGPWSEPDETLEEPDYGKLDMPENPQINVIFKDRTGKDCEQHLVIFKRNQMLLTKEGGQLEAWLPYLVDNSDLGDILRLVGSCAAR